MIVTDMLGDAGTPLTIEGSDTAQSIPKTTWRQTIHEASMACKGALLTCEDNTIKFTFDGTTPTNEAGDDDGHTLAAGDSYVIRGINNVRNFQCINDVSASVGKVKVTPFF